MVATPPWVTGTSQASAFPRPARFFPVSPLCISFSWKNPPHQWRPYPSSLCIKDIYALNRAERKLAISEEGSEAVNAQGKTRRGRTERQRQDAHNKDSLKL